MASLTNVSERVIVDVPRRLDRAVDEAVEVAGTVSLTVHGGPGATETWIQGVDYPTYPSIECTKMTVVPLDHQIMCRSVKESEEGSLQVRVSRHLS